MTSTRIAALALVAAVSGITFGPLTATADTSWTTDTSTDGSTTCQPYTAAHHDAGVAAGDIDPGMWDDLMALGWHGVQGDRQEALYAPECQ